MRVARRDGTGLAGSIAAVVFCLLMLSGSASAGDMSSASYRARGGATNAGSVAQVSTAASPAFAGAAGSLGQREALGLGGSASSLRTSRAGFWAIEQGGLPSLDLDDDEIQAFLDPDDDNDGLEDVVETNTGVYVSPLDTGSDPLNPDSDGDGVDDGTEVAAGRDPNLAEPPIQVPALAPIGRLFGVVGLALAAAVRLFAVRKEAQS